MKSLLYLLLFVSVNVFGEQRIITLSPSINEIVFALGSGDDIVANTQFSNFPQKSKKIAKVGGYSSVSLEKILLAKPSVILAQNYDQKLIKNIKKLNLNIHTFKTDNLQSIKSTIKQIGKLLHKVKQADILREDINKALKSIENIISNKKILVVISPREDLNKTIFVAGNNLYFNDIIEQSGNTNAYFSSSLSQPMVNIEKIIKMNPDIIIMLAPYMHQNGISYDKLQKNWLDLPINAAKQKKIYIVDKEYAGIPSHRVVHFIEDFKDILVDVRDK
ncbi:MAG: helical backbone metal receptor [Arcobacteraceae bacterium]